MDILIRLIVIIISQFMHMTKLHIVHLKYTQFLFVNYNFNKAGKIYIW